MSTPRPCSVTRFGIIGPGDYPYRPFGLFVLALLVASALLVVNTRRGPLGRHMLAIRANERAAAASGVPVARVKIQGAAVSSFIAALAGLVFAYKNVDFSWSGLEASRGLQVLALAYLGGVTSVTGSVIAGLLAPSGLVIVALGSPPAAGQQLLLTGLGLLLVTIRFPAGLAAIGPWMRRRFLAARADADEAPPPDAEEIRRGGRGVRPAGRRRATLIPAHVTRVFRAGGVFGAGMPRTKHPGRLGRDRKLTHQLV